MDTSNESDSGKDEEMLLKKIKMEKEDDQSLSSEGEKSCEVEKTEENPTEDENGIYLPAEILEIIIGFLDGKTLAIVRQVSRKLKAIADRRIRLNSTIWIDFCISEIPIEQIHDYLHHNDSKFFLRMTVIPEISKIYKRWYLWKTFLSLDKNFYHIIVGSGSPICQIKCSGDYIVIGTNSGLYCFNYGAVDVKRLIIFSNENYASLKWFSLRSTVVEPTYEDRTFYGLAHDIATFELSSAVYELSFFPQLHLRKLYNKRFAVASKQYLAESDTQVFLESTRTNCTIHVEMNSGRKTSKFYNTNFKLLTVYHSVIMLYEYISQQIKVIDLDFNELRDHPLHNDYLRDRWNLDHYVIGLDAIITYSARGDPEPLTIKIGRWTRVMPTLDNVTSVLFYGSHLFLGTRNGAIIVFFIKTFQDLHRLEDLSMQEVERKEVIVLSDNPIVAIDVRDASPISSIIAGTATDVFEIRFSLFQNLSDVCLKQFLP